MRLIETIYECDKCKHLFSVEEINEHESNCNVDNEFSSSDFRYVKNSDNELIEKNKYGYRK